MRQVIQSSSDVLNILEKREYFLNAITTANLINIRFKEMQSHVSMSLKMVNGEVKNFC